MVLVYGFFLNRSKPTIAIATIITIMTAAIPRARADIVATFDTGVDVGAGVAGGALAQMCVSAEDPQYEFEPAKVAIIVQLPVMSGVHVKAQVPLASDVAVPMTLSLPFESMTDKVT